MARATSDIDVSKMMCAHNDWRSPSPGATRTTAPSGKREHSSESVTITGLPMPISRMAMPEVSPAAG
jgi:hypothetical protein